MNKSTFTNLTALAVLMIGWFSPWYQDQILSIGIFALSGALTNWLAVYMLFEKIPFLYGSGIIPAHFQEFKVAIRRLILDQFFKEENIKRLLDQEMPLILDKLNPADLLQELDFDRIYDELTKMVLASGIGGLLGMFGGANALENYRGPFKEKAVEFISRELQGPAVQEALHKRLTNPEMVKMLISQVGRIVDTRLEELTPDMVKMIIQEMIRKHLGWLVVWGGVFGGLIGLVASFIPNL